MSKLLTFNSMEDLLAADVQDVCHAKVVVAPGVVRYAVLGTLCWGVVGRRPWGDDDGAVKLWKAPASAAERVKKLRAHYARWAALETALAALPAEGQALRNESRRTFDSIIHCGNDAEQKLSDARRALANAKRAYETERANYEALGVPEARARAREAHDAAAAAWAEYLAQHPEFSALK